MASPWYDPALIAHAVLLDASHRHWLERPLLDNEREPAALAEALYHAPFALVSHGTEDDPLFHYANLTAQGLWALDWAHFVGMPSRYSAEPRARSERAKTLGGASRTGFTTGYRGERVSARGRRFRILDGVIWNLVDATGNLRGQAARFSQWEYLQSPLPAAPP
jgi:hypothetical protein